MDSRRKLVYSVLAEGLSLSEACRVEGVTRKTGLKWLNRAREVGIDQIAELSRAPKSVPRRTQPSVEEALLRLKEEYPVWGARKLAVLYEKESGQKVPSRTVDRILKRSGKTKPAPARLAPIRFERESCGALLQMDFKGLPRTIPYSLLTVLDDHARFCLMFSPVRDRRAPSVQEALWECFGEHGLPEEMLMDNGDCWGAPASSGPTAFCAWLMRLGIRPIHGRPLHPQTQGKVERFHGTVKTEVGDALFEMDSDQAKERLGKFVNRYNWVRPHDSLAGGVPGSLYRPFSRTRPDKVPVHQICEKAVKRKVDASGYFGWNNERYRIGAGLAGEYIVIQEAELGLKVHYAGFPLKYLRELNHSH